MECEVKFTENTLIGIEESSCSLISVYKVLHRRDRFKMSVIAQQSMKRMEILFRREIEHFIFELITLSFQLNKNNSYM